MGIRRAPAYSINEQGSSTGYRAARTLHEGDIVGVDIGAYLNHFHGDGARTFAVGAISTEAQKLMRVTRECLDIGIEQARPGNRVGDIGAAVQPACGKPRLRVWFASSAAMESAMRFHGVPQVPNYGQPGTGTKLRPGMVIAIEPMLNEGTHEVYTLDDEWTVVTSDHSLSAHYEHTVAITEEGPVVLTVRPDDRGVR